MPFELLVGPPASGKTTRALVRARSAAGDGRRVWWVGLPNQRAYLYRRATEAGGILGLEFLTVQQVTYRLLADALRLRRIVVGAERLVLVGEALAELDAAPPAPGEARLYAFGIAEAKRFRLRPDDVPVHDATTERLRDAFRAYERIKGDAWDYDDFRVRALELVREDPVEVEADLIVVDGVREVGPLDLALYRALGRHADVLLCLPEPPPGLEPTESLSAPTGPEVVSHLATNPVAEARWVLRSLKRDLAQGHDPLDLAVVMPPSRSRGFAALADEYGVPLMDEIPRPLSETRAGRRLVDLLALADTPTASRLLAVPELEPLARLVLQEGVAGPEAVSALADATGHDEPWRTWHARVARTDMEGVHDLVELACQADPVVRRAEAFRARALRHAQEASRLGTGGHFRAWWLALLEEPAAPEPGRGGVALLDPVRASGRRFARVYVTYAVAGAYRPGTGEDWFVPEDMRVAWQDVFTNPGARQLPRRLRGAAGAFWADLRTRGEQVVVTCPRADRDGPLEPAPELVDAPKPIPPVPAGSRLDLAEGVPWTAGRDPVNLDDPRVERLRRFDACGFRMWAEDLLEVRAHGGETTHEDRWWRALRADLMACERLDEVRLESLAAAHPDAAGWLAVHAEALCELTWGVRLESADGGPYVRLDAARRAGSTAEIYLFVAPGGVSSPREAEDVLRDRWSEYWAAGRLLQGYGGRIERVDIRVWPILGDPVDVFDGGITTPWRRVVRAQQGVERAFAAYREGVVEPRPGFVCRTCGVIDICREGAT